MSAQNNRVHHGEDDGTARHSVATALATSTLATAPVAGHAGSVGPASNAKATDAHGPAINTAALPAARPSRPRPLSRLSGLPLKISSLRKGSSRLVTPTDATAEPLGLLVVRILAARSLTAKDRNGRSDPFLHIRVGQGRAESEVVKACLNPAWGELEEPFSAEFKPDGSVAKEAFCVAPVYAETIRRTRVEVVCFDKDRFSKNDYLGEISLTFEDWLTIAEDRVNLSYSDPLNKPRWRPLVSSRSKKSEVSGDLLVKVGFIASPPSSPAIKKNTGVPADSKLFAALSAAASATASISTHGTRKHVQQNPLSDQQEDRIRDALSEAVLSTRIAAMGLSNGKYASPSRHERAVSKAAAKEERVFDAPPNEGVGTLRIGERTHGALSNAITDQAELYDSDSSDMTDRDALEHLDHDYSSDSSAVFETSDTGPEADDYFNTALGMSSAPNPAAADLPAAVPKVQGVAAEDPHGFVQASGPGTPSAIEKSTKRRLGVPSFLKRNSSFGGSSKSKDSSASTSQTLEILTSDSTPASGATTPGAYRRKRFTRRKVYLGVDDSSDVGPVDFESGGHGGHSKRKEAKTGRRRKTSDLSAAEKSRGGLSTGAQHLETLGIVFLEIKSADNLPRWRNVTRTGWDMDPFVIVSFGKKVFRTRVVRHSRNPVWDERLFFHVQRHEEAFQVLFTILDWDKMSSNDYVGEVPLLLAELEGKAPKPDNLTGVYAANKDGKIVGDDLHDFTMRIGTKSAELEDDKSKMTFTIRAKFTPYSALRQRFWRTYLKQYDTDDSETWSYVELYTMLDSLGSTLTKSTIDSFFTRFDKTPEQTLTIEEAIICLEDELTKPRSEKRKVDAGMAAQDENGHDAIHTGTSTPGSTHLTHSPELSLGDNAVGGMSFTGLPLTGEPANGVPAKDQPARGSVPRPTSYLITDHSSTSLSVKSQGSGVSRQSSLSESAYDGEGNHAESHELEKLINIRTCPLCHKSLHKKAEVDLVSHLAVCASQDWSSLNSLTVANFVSTSQAQRKWFSKFVNKVSNGAYKLGADSANILVQNRLTGQLQEEKMQVYVRVGIRLWYRAAGSSSRMEANRIKKLLRNMTMKQGIKFDAPESVAEIPHFIAFHSLKTDEIADPLDSFSNFNSFFYRKLKPDARPCDDPQDSTTLVSSADCRFTCFQTINEATKLWIKGRSFTIKRLLGDAFAGEAGRYDGGSVCIFRLAPQDYHRYHSAVDGKIDKMSHITGEYYTVNPIAIRSGLDVYAENARTIVAMDSPIFGRVMNVCIGAMMVGSIKFTKNEGEEVKRAEEYGYFAFGGSTILILFEPNTVIFDEDLVNNSKACIETLVRVGMRIGKRV